MSVWLIREQYDYHRWANRRLFDLAAGLGTDATRDMGKHWSFPTLKAMFAHLYAADAVWLARWKGSAPTRLAGDADFASMSDLRQKWDALEAEQKVQRVGGADPRTNPGRTPSRARGRTRAQRHARCRE